MAFHRRDMIHQDLRPENVLIDSAGKAWIIDFGSTQVAGIAESGLGLPQPGLLGTALYAAPEYFVGDAGSWRSDLYSLGVIAYFMLTGRFPYGNQVARSRSLAAQRTLQYQPLADESSDIPLWVDHAIRKAVHPDPLRRQDSLSEFLHDLQQPAADFTPQQRALLERNPLAFWQGATFVLGVVVLVLLYRLAG
jgi:protein phosphatase